MAAVARFLVSDAASYVTGEVIRVDGGMAITHVMKRDSPFSSK